MQPWLLVALLIATPAVPRNAPTPPPASAPVAAPAPKPRTEARKVAAPAPNLWAGGAVALDYTQAKDYALERIRHDGANLAVHLLGSYATQDGEHRVELHGLSGSLSNRYGLESEHVRIAAGYSYLHRVFASSDREWSVRAGARAAMRDDAFFFNRIDEAHLYWSTTYGLDAVGEAHYRPWTAGTVGLTVALPVAGLVSRAPAHRLYNNDSPPLADLAAQMHDNLHVASWGEFRAIETRLAYTHAFSPGLREFVAYDFRTSRIDSPRRVQLLTHALLAGIQWGW